MRTASQAVAGVGVSNPEDVYAFVIGEQTPDETLLSAWNGAEYDAETCWIEASTQDVCSLDEWR
jgi:hypothetical protein